METAACRLRVGGPSAEEMFRFSSLLLDMLKRLDAREGGGGAEEGGSEEPPPAVLRPHALHMELHRKCSQLQLHEQQVRGQRGPGWARRE